MSPTLAPDSGRPDPRPPDSHHLDTLGKVCPLPILMTAKVMLDLRCGERLTVVGDDPAILEDMPIFCYRAGYRLLGMSEAEDGTIRCEIEKH